MCILRLNWNQLQKMQLQGLRLGVEAAVKGIYTTPYFDFHLLTTSVNAKCMIIIHF